MSLTIVKLGGSAITDKSKTFCARDNNIERLAKELKDAADVSGDRYIIVHGGGSFGHPLARKYNLNKGYYNMFQVKGIAETQIAMRALNLKVMHALLRAHINAVSLPPGSLATCRNRAVVKLEKELFSRYLKLGLTPVTFGDVVPDKVLGFCICSGDTLVLELAKLFKPRQVIFAMNEDGFYDKDPSLKTAKLIPELNAEIFGRVSKKIVSKRVPDVTGGALSKMKLSLEISKFAKVIVLNGNVENRLRNALLGRRITCTRIER